MQLLVWLCVTFLAPVIICGSFTTIPNLLKFVFGTTGVAVNSALSVSPSLDTNINDPDYNRGLPELIKSLGYPVEQYEVQTADGYILGVYRIPYGQGMSYFNFWKKPVLIVHGTAGNGWDFVMNYYSYQNLACILADAGYDVFLGNLRGNIYSQKHVRLSTDQPEFWDFNFDQMGYYDVPAMIDFVLDKTGYGSLSYIAHSLGTTSLFALLSTRTEYNNKINLACLMSPVAKLSYATAPILDLYQFKDILPAFSAITGVEGMIPATALQPSIKSRVICGVEILNSLCRVPDEIGGGADSGHLNETRLPVYSHHSNSGTSVYVFVHYAQIINTKEFKKYDYGTDENLKRYNQKTPPVYQLNRISANIGLYSSTSDALADQKDIDFLRKSISSVEIDRVVEPDFSHIDFLWAIDAYKYVYNPMLQDINRYS